MGPSANRENAVIAGKPEAGSECSQLSHQPQKVLLSRPPRPILLQVPECISTLPTLTALFIASSLTASDPSEPSFSEFDRNVF